MSVLVCLLPQHQEHLSQAPRPDGQGSHALCGEPDQVLCGTWTRPTAANGGRRDASNQGTGMERACQVCARMQHQQLLQKNAQAAQGRLGRNLTGSGMGVCGTATGIRLVRLGAAAEGVERRRSEKTRAQQVSRSGSLGWRECLCGLRLEKSWRGSAQPPLGEVGRGSAVGRRCRALQTAPAAHWQRVLLVDYVPRRAPWGAAWGGSLGGVLGGCGGSPSALYLRLTGETPLELELSERFVGCRYRDGRPSSTAKVSSFLLLAWPWPDVPTNLQTNASFGPPIASNVQVSARAALGSLSSSYRQKTPEAPTSTCEVPLPQVLTGHRGPGLGSQAGIAIALKGNPLADRSHTSSSCSKVLRALLLLCCCQGIATRPRQSISGMCLFVCLTLAVLM
ncbi:hypothetical protein TgHK011_005014 [Trichoderma gracile]|nr:hypothetical protein TgHK011_005014 [Trichoderma gracile]